MNFNGCRYDCLHLWKYIHQSRCLTWWTWTVGEACSYLSGVIALHLQLLQFFLNLPHSASHLLLSTLTNKEQRLSHFLWFSIAAQACRSNHPLPYFRPPTLNYIQWGRQFYTGRWMFFRNNLTSFQIIKSFSRHSLSHVSCRPVTHPPRRVLPEDM